MRITRHNPIPERRAARFGFTLIELLVVITIISILASLSIAVVANYTATAKEAATKATLLKLNRMMNERLSAFHRTLDAPEFQRQLDAKTEALKRQDIYGLRPQAVETLVKKDLQRKYFPQRFSDLGITSPPAGHDPITESSEMLYYMLTAMKVFGVAPVDPGEFEGAIADSDNDGWPELVDAWDQPLRFYRWPTRLIRPGGAGNPVRRDVAGTLIVGLPNPPAPPNPGRDELTLDPDDRTSAIRRDLSRVPELGMVWRLQPASPTQPYYHDLDTFHAPLIVSPGPDLNLGIFEPTDVANFGHLAQPEPATLTSVDPLLDNFTNRNIVVGGN